MIRRATTKTFGWSAISATVRRFLARSVRSTPACSLRGSDARRNTRRSRKGGGMRSKLYHHVEPRRRCPDRRGGRTSPEYLRPSPPAVTHAESVIELFSYCDDYASRIVFGFIVGDDYSASELKQMWRGLRTTVQCQALIRRGKRKQVRSATHLVSSRY